MLKPYATSLQNIVVWRSPQTQQVLSPALESIDAVHKVASLPSIPVELATPQQIQSRGVYQYIPTEFSGGKRPVAFRIQVRRTPPSEQAFAQEELSLVHEVGHFIDQQGWQGNGWASEQSEEWAEWRAAVAGSAAVQELQRLQGREQVVIPQRSNMLLTVPKNRLRYLLQGRELWARSYSQQVAAESGEGTLLRQLDQEREKNNLLYFPVQWEDADFAPIAEAITRLLKKKAWK